MSKIRVKTQGELRKFLEILAEEAVQLAKSDVDAKSQQARVAADIKQSKTRFMQEQDPPSPVTPATPADAAAEKQAAPVQTPEPKKTGADIIQPKLGELIDAINKLRGVPSTKDTNVEEKLRTYFDTLTPAEASSLLVMVRSVGEVMDSRADPVTAKDPRDYDILTKFKDELEKAKKASKAEEEEPEVSSPEKSPDKIEPPIKVGAPQQVTEAYRARIKKLMGVI